MAAVSTLASSGRFAAPSVRSISSSGRFAAPSVRSNARRGPAIGIGKHSAGSAPAVGRRCMPVAAMRQPGTLPKMPEEMPKWMDPNYNGMLPEEKWMDPNYNKWSDPEFLRRQARIALLPLVLAGIFIWVGWWPVALLWGLVITPLVIQKY